MKKIVDFKKTNTTCGDNNVVKEVSKTVEICKTEELSNSAKKRLEKEEAKKTIYADSIGQFLIFQTKGGMRIEGNLKLEKSNYIKISPVIIFGKEYITTVEWVCLDKQQIAHFHGKPLNVEKVK